LSRDRTIATVGDESEVPASEHLGACCELAVVECANAAFNFSAGHIGVLSPTDATAMGSLGVL